MLFKKSFSLLIVIVFIFTSVLAQFSWAAEVSEATLLEDLSGRNGYLWNYPGKAFA